MAEDCKYRIDRSNLHHVRKQASGYLCDLDTRVTTLSDYAVVAAYGGITQSVPVALPDLGAGFTVVPADTGAITVPRAVIQDVANNGLALLTQGVWVMHLGLSLEHAESNNGRQITVQLYNFNKSTASTGVVVPIARNQPGTLIGLSLMFEVPAANIGDILQIRIGGGDAVTAVEVQSYAFSVNHVGEFVAPTVV